MVSETAIETPVETDLVPEPEVTEDAPVPVEEEAVAAPEVEEAAAEEPKQVEPVEERRYTQAELDDMARQSAQAAIEYDRRMRQSENARRAAEGQRAEREAQELRDTIEVTLGKAGFTDVGEDTVNALISRVNAKRGGFDVERAQGEMQQAMEWVTAPLRGDPRSYAEFGLSPTADAFARAIQPHLQQILSAGSTAAVEGYIPQSELPKLIDAEIARRNAKAREGKTELKRVDGTPPANDTSTVADRLDRIGTPRETPQDRQWWDDRAKARGRR